jgi:hypothetical protein
MLKLSRDYYSIFENRRILEIIICLNFPFSRIAYNSFISLSHSFVTFLYFDFVILCGMMHNAHLQAKLVLWEVDQCGETTI